MAVGPLLHLCQITRVCNSGGETMSQALEGGFSR
jgi:hypothetical protein